MYTIVNWPSLQKRVHKGTREESYEINSTIIFLFHRIQDGQVFEFTKAILFLKMYLGVGLAPSSQTVGSSSIPPGQQCRLRNYLSIAPIDLANSKI